LFLVLSPVSGASLGRPSPGLSSAPFAGCAPSSP